MPAISFDLDGVLIQNPFGKGVIPRIRAHIRSSPRLAGLDVTEADGRINRAIRSAWGARMASGDFVSAYDWDGIYNEVSRGFGGSPAPDVASLVRECCREEGLIALLPGARATLERLKASGFTLVAATNGYHAYQWPVLEALGIAELFATVLSPDTAGHAKPDPRYFAGVPDLVAHVGDTLEHDVLGANLAGLVSVWLSPGLPASICALPEQGRTHAPDFATYLEGALEAALYREYHAEANLENCRPDYVASHVSEVPDLLAGIESGVGAEG